MKNVLAISVSTGWDRMDVSRCYTNTITPVVYSAVFCWKWGLNHDDTCFRDKVTSERRIQYSLRDCYFTETLLRL